MSTYATLADVRSASHIVDQVDDDQLLGSLRAACRQVNAFCRRTFSPSPSAVRVYAPRNSLRLPIDDAIAITKVETSTNLDGVFDITWATTDYQLAPLNGIVNGDTWPAEEIHAVGRYWFPWYEGTLFASVRVTATWGWSYVPDDVRQATILQTLRLWKRLDSPLGVMGGPETGLIRVARQVDGDVAQLLTPYVRGADLAGVA